MLSITMEMFVMCLITRHLTCVRNVFMQQGKKAEIDAFRYMRPIFA